MLIGMAMMTLMRRILRAMFDKPDTDWELTVELLRGPCMRRRVAGRWQYRPMTPEEQHRWVSIDTW